MPAASADGLGLELDRASRTPYYRQIYSRLVEAIVRGVLQPGARLPSTRCLASQLATSRGTIDLAYGMLSGDGYVLSLGAAGTVVAPGLPDGGGRSSLPTGGKNVADGGSAAETFAVKPFQMGQPALDAFPLKLWTRLAARHARALTPSMMATWDSMGYRPLREAVASYVAVSRGAICSADHVIITPGFQAGLGMIARVLLEPGDRVWVEDPCYFAARDALRLAGARLVGVPVDAEGMDAGFGAARASDARFAYVTPSHQAPLGVTLSVERRALLLDWASRMGAWIVEDDYDAEFRYGSPPLPALKSLDRAGRVIYAGSFSKVLFPGLRLGYVVVPEELLGRFHEVRVLLSNDCPTLNQAVVAEFLLEGHFARHIRQMRTLYASRRAALAGALVSVFGSQIDLQLRDGGMHLLARFPGCDSDREWVARASRQGLAPVALSKWRVERDCGQGLLLGFTNVAAEDAKSAAVRLKKAVGL
ncbi:MAG: PLP-dependent aminotransferase family protein [Bryobacteraceae bacterium]